MRNFTHSSTLVLCDGTPFADAVDPRAAAEIAVAMSPDVALVIAFEAGAEHARSEIATYIDSQANRRRGWLATGFRVLASNVRARLDEKEDSSDG